MTKLEESISTILERIRPKLADSSYELRRVTFDQLIRMASEMGISEPVRNFIMLFTRTTMVPDRGNQCTARY